MKLNRKYISFLALGFILLATGLVVGIIRYQTNIKSKASTVNVRTLAPATAPAAAPIRFTLKVVKTGTGTGTVTSSPAGINCGTTCSSDFTKGTVVTLTARPSTGSSAGSKFMGWVGSGGCSGGNLTLTCSTRPIANDSVTATFNLIATPTPTPTGTVTPIPTPTPIVTPTVGPTVAPILIPTLIPPIRTGAPKLSVEAKDAQGRAVQVAQMGRVECDQSSDNPKTCIQGSRQSNISSDTYVKGSLDANKEWIGVMIRLKDNQRLVAPLVRQDPDGSTISGCYQNPATGYYCAVWRDFTTGERRATFIVATTTGPTPPISPTVPPTGTSLSLNVFMHGIGNSGDNVNPNGSGSNKNPLTPTRNINVEIFNSFNQGMASGSGIVNYASESGNFKGTIDISGVGGVPIENGPFTIKIKTPTHLRRLLPGLQSLSIGQNNIMPEISLIAGDVNNDNALNILDYNLLTGCISDLAPAVSCTAENKKLADLNDDGNVNQIDLILYLREVAVQSGN